MQIVIHLWYTFWNFGNNRTLVVIYQFSISRNNFSEFGSDFEISHLTKIYEYKSLVRGGSQGKISQR